MSNDTGHVAFQLKDFFHENPLRTIYSKGQKDRHFFNAYVDYSQDLATLQIAWQRIREGCKVVGEIHNRIGQIPPPNEEPDNESTSLIFRQGVLMNILQYDVGSFINIVRVIMDKVAKLIEKLLGISPGKGRRVSFTDHKKKLPIQHPNIHPIYLDLLQNRTHWYEQELLLLRDKVYAHGNTFITEWQVSEDGGIKITRKSEIGPLNERHKKALLDIKIKYERRRPSLRVTNNEYLILYDLLRQARKQNIKFDENDVIKLGNIVSSSGIIIDEEFLESIAQHLEGFIKQVAAIFAESV